MAESGKEETGSSLQAQMDVGSVQPVEVPGKLRLLDHIFCWRGVIYFLLQFTFIAWSVPRSALSMAFVCINSRREDILQMINASGVTLAGGEGQGEGGNSSQSSNTSEPNLEQYQYVLGDIAWSSDTIGLVLSAPMVLAFLGPIISDVVIQRHGCRYLFTAVQVVNAAIMFSSPGMARAHPYLLMTGHAIIGLTTNTNIPIIATLVARWTPLKHKLIVMATVYTGATVGSVFSSLVNGFLCSIPVDNGWPFLFYTAGTIHAIYALAWFCLVGEYPETHRFISEKEKNYIISRRAELSHGAKNQKADRPPYRVILTSVPVLAYMFSNVCFVWTMTLFLVYVPIYLNAVHEFTPRETGIAFAVICAIRISGAFFWSSLGNLLTNRKILSLPVTRKACITIGMTVSACSSVVVSFFDRDNRWTAVIFVMLCLFCQAVSTGHINAVPMDMAPRYAGTISSLAISPALLAATSGPIIVAAITPTGSYDEWRLVWYLLAAVFMSYCLVFLFFGQAKLQPWAAATDPKDDKPKDPLLKT